jgi:hypothetical protein
VVRAVATRAEKKLSESKIKGKSYKIKKL